ncbi:MAG TPA: protein phosphatase 2C domain-containing protein, partial [Fibrobacteria bacterium]|nr:protein phosphatase 2C domain-containing protein [Fibrobacteria bacterium]
MMLIPRDPSAVPPPPPDPVSTDHLPVRLPNARQGAAYEHEFSVHHGSEAVLFRWEAEPADCGLLLDPRRMVVFGTPTAPGECQVVAFFRDPRTGEETRRVGQVYVNADPRSLWKDTPSSPETPFWKPDLVSERLDGPHATLIAARRRGRSHAHVGSCCDDDFHLASAGDWSIAVVADGAGSAKASRLGSRLAVEAAGAFLVRVLSGQIGQELSERAATLAGSTGDAAVARGAVMAGLWTTVGAAAHEAMKA